MRRPTIVVCFVLSLIALWLTQTLFQTKEKRSESKASTAIKTLGSTSATPKAKKPPVTRKPLQVTSKGKVRLKPGETAVLGYWTIAPGMNGMAMVTPETTPEGHVKTTAKLLQIPDAAVSDADAQDLFPDIFDFENYSAVSSERLRELQTALQNAHGVEMLSTPAVISASGQPARISIGNSNGSMLSLGLRADPVAEDGGYELSLELQRQE